jgi:single-stranded-DNA-specific exonuclease
MFALARLRLLEAIPVGAEHIRLRAASMDGVGIDAIAFRAAGKPLGEALRQARGGLVHLVGSLTLNRWGGRERAELRIVDAAAAIG